MIILLLLKLGITMLIHNKDDIEFVTEFPFLFPCINFATSFFNYQPEKGKRLLRCVYNVSARWTVKTDKFTLFVSCNFLVLHVHDIEFVTEFPCLLGHPVFNAWSNKAFTGVRVPLWVWHCLLKLWTILDFFYVWTNIKWWCILV